MNDVCSLELLTNAVANRLTADEETALYDHLERCEACCARMEQLAGGEQWQKEAASLLTTDELDSAVPEPTVWSEVDFSVEHLEPSEDANVLGQLGGYDVLAIIGRGGMGVVLKAFDRELKRFVAIKALSPHLAHSSVARKRFAREAQAAAAVVNPHVIAIHHVQPTGRLPFLIMPLLTGESLAQRLKSRAPLELTEVLRIGMQAAVGLAAAHDQGLVHRDVKPANIFLEKGVERVVITDFGLARAADDVSMTRLGVVAGTPEYMSPEQARGEAMDGRSDLFSLGCVLYEMATGVSPFRSDSTIATLRRIVDDKPIAMASLTPELPPWFSYIVERLLSKDPTQRFASASDVALLLEACLSHLQQPTSVPLPASLVSHVKGSRSIFNSNKKGIVTMLGTLGAVLLGMVLWQTTEPPDISGQWTSDEWGIVVLEAKGPGQYEGTFTDFFKGQSAEGEYSGTGGGKTPDGTDGVLLGSPGLTDPGKSKSSTLHLKWSRVERRFNGTWKSGENRNGKMSLRLVDNEIRGAWTTNKGTQKEPASPRLADLRWKRNGVADNVHGEVYGERKAYEDPDSGTQHNDKKLPRTVTLYVRYADYHGGPFDPGDYVDVYQTRRNYDHEPWREWHFFKNVKILSTTPVVDASIDNGSAWRLEVKVGADSYVTEGDMVTMLPLYEKAMHEGRVRWIVRPAKSKPSSEKVSDTLDDSIIKVTQANANTPEEVKAKDEAAKAWLRRPIVGSTNDATNSQTNVEVRQVFAYIDGEVHEVLIGDNSVVTKGQVLLRMRNSELQVELSKTSDQTNEANLELDRLVKKLQDNKGLPVEEVEKAKRERSELQKRVLTLSEQMTRLNERCELLVVKSTVAGTIITKDVQQLLRNRPVVTGQVLLEIAVEPSRKFTETSTDSVEVRADERFGIATLIKPMSLRDAVTKFNQLAKEHPLGRQQPELTVEEMTAAFREWIARKECTEATRKDFQQVLDTQMLRPGHALLFDTEFETEGHLFEVWSIQFGDDKSYAWFKIRESRLRSRLKTDEERKAWEQRIDHMKKSFRESKLRGGTPNAHKTNLADSEPKDATKILP